MSHVFISYSKKNRTYARQLADHLLSLGFDVWIDDRIDYGDDWWRTIVRAIRDASAFIVIMSDASDSSEWVQREVIIANKNKTPAFPLWLSGDFHQSENWAIYVRTQYIDVRDGQLPSDDFFERLANIAKRHPKTGTNVTPPDVEKPASKPRLNIGAIAVVGIGIVALLIIATFVVNHLISTDTFTHSPNPTPLDGGTGQIAFTSDRDGNSEIYVMNADGTNQRRLTNNLVGDYAPSWSQDCFCF